MLQIRFRNIIIQEENHSDLLREEINKLLERLTDVFNTSEHHLKTMPPHEVCYSFVRINQKLKMYICFFPEAVENPYLFFWDKEKNEISNRVSFQQLRILNNDSSEAFLKDAVKDINAPRFLRLQSKELTDALADSFSSLGF